MISRLGLLKVFLLIGMFIIWSLTQVYLFNGAESLLVFSNMAYPIIKKASERPSIQTLSQSAKAGSMVLGFLPQLFGICILIHLGTSYSALFHHLLFQWTGFTAAWLTCLQLSTYFTPTIFLLEPLQQFWNYLLLISLNLLQQLL